MVLLNAGASSVRILDALKVRRYIAGDEAPVVARARSASSVRASARRAPVIKASAARAPVVKASVSRTRAKHVKLRRHRQR
jgi:D-alanyl-D-alanine carboxypeptidase/D-alanyl-D-alanine endopeptidase (penicillin-binding protein 7)